MYEQEVRLHRSAAPGLVVPPYAVPRPGQPYSGSQVKRETPSVMPSTRSGLVLVAEMDGTVCMVTVDLLEDAGFRTLMATSVDEVLSVLRNTNGVHTLITGRSVRFPGDGIELAHRVHALWPNIRVIVTSGAGGDVCEGLPRGVRFLQKPYYFTALLREVEDGLSGTDHQPSSAPVVPDGIPVLTGASATVGIGVAAAPVSEPDRS